MARDAFRIFQLRFLAGSVPWKCDCYGYTLLCNYTVYWLSNYYLDLMSHAMKLMLLALRSCGA